MTIIIERFFDHLNLDTLLFVTNIYLYGFPAGIVPGEKTTEVQS